MMMTFAEAATALPPPLLKLDALTASFFPVPTPESLPRPLLEGVSLQVNAGELVGLVGESGCGKSLTCQAILGLLPEPARVLSGSIQLQGQELTTLTPKQWERIRGKKIALIPQDPMTSLNPLLTVGEQLEEVLVLHTSLNKQERQQRAIELLEAVKIPNPQARLQEYPHQFSGGMCQRVLIALALASEPALLLADEPTTALDVTVQAQILALLDELRHTRGMGILLITHDLGVVAEVCQRVVVMYAGHVVESAPTDVIFNAPRHPYTQALLASVPSPSAQATQVTQATTEGRQRLYSLEGIPPSAKAMPLGCRFLERCRQAVEACHQGQLPPMLSLTQQHEAKCLVLDRSESDEAPPA